MPYKRNIKPILGGIGKKLFSAFLLFSLLPLILSIYQGYTSSRRAMEERILLQIETVSRYIENSVSYFIQEREFNLGSLVAGNELMLNCVETMQNPSATLREKEEALKKLSEQIAGKDREDKNSYNLMIIGKNGSIITAVNPALAGMDRTSSEYFMKGSIGIATSIAYKGSVPMITVSAPIRNRRGGLAGVLVKSVNLSHLFSLLKEGEKLGKSSRIVFVASWHSVLREFDGEAEEEISTGGINEAFQKNYVTGSYITSDGKRVAASYRLIPKLGWVLACEVDEEEAFGPLTALRDQAVAFGVLLFFILIGGAYYIAKGITKPIEELAEATVEFGRGNLARRVRFRTDDEIGDMAAAFNTMADRLQKNVLQHERYLTNITDSSADAIMSLDTNNMIATWNKGAEEMFGYTKEEIVGKPFRSLIPPDLLDKWGLEGFINESEKSGVLKNYETQQLTKEGKRINVAVTRTPLQDNDGNIIGCSAIVRDITEKKNLEKQIIQSEKLSAVGELTAGLAHEIGTPLNIISGRAEYLISLVRDDLKMTSGLRSIIRQIDRITLLIQQLLKFTRSEKKESRSLDINRVIKDTLMLLETKLDKSGVMINTSFSEKIPPMEGDENQIQQVFINIFLNAIHAMPDGGSLGIDTRFDDVGTIMVVVSDDGTGIEEKSVSKIFDPFFTTKEIGKGTGLGLAVTYGIVKDHGGTIDVKSRVNEGTTL